MSRKPKAPQGGGMRSAGPTPGVFPPPDSMRPTVYGDRWAVAAGHPRVALVAARVLEAGGNAIDAGVAAGLAANVVEVEMANFGGIAPILVKPAGRDEVFSIAGVGTWGGEVTPERFLDRYRGDMPLGAGVAIVPGTPAAWTVALESFGTLSFAEAAAPAIELAAEGYVVDIRQASALEIMGRTFARWPSSAAIYWPEGRPPRPGERLRQPQLAGLLSELAAAGSFAEVRRSFYQGRPAAEIAAFVQAEGGWLTPRDLARFEADVAVAPSVPFGDLRVYSPPTWSQGPALLQALRLLAPEATGSGGDGTGLASPVDGARHNRAGYVDRVATALRLAFEDRERYYADPSVVGVDLEWLLSAEHARELLRGGATGAASGGGRRAWRRELASFGHGTTALCVVDASGNAFSATPSDTLDGGPIVPGLGILVSPRGVQSRTEPGHPNALAPGKRPRVTPSPVIAADNADGSCVLAMAAGGGDVILQAILQGLLNHVTFGMPLQQAVEAARFATFDFPGSFYPHPHLPGCLKLERRIPAAVRRQLAASGYDVSSWPAFEFDAGGLVMAGSARASPGADAGGGALGESFVTAGADPRRSCFAIAG